MGVQFNMNPVPQDELQVGINTVNYLHCNTLRYVFFFVFLRHCRKESQPSVHTNHAYVCTLLDTLLLARTGGDIHILIYV